MAWPLALVPVLLACPPQAQDIPNRVLDRPLDVALNCVRVVCDDTGECHGEAASLRECRGETGSCSASGNHLVGFVANSERNEVAVFTQCSGDLVDMDVQAPGYNFIPVGNLPSTMAASADGCRAISANAGSCDLTVLDAPNLGAFGLDVRAPTRLTPEGNRVPVEPSTLVANVVPRRLRAAPMDGDSDQAGGWTALGSRPTDLVAVPRQLSTSTQDMLPDDPILDLCGPDQPGSAYVAFASCNLVAEVDLTTQRILQSFRLELTDDGVEVVDTGVAPICPIDCPGAFAADELPDDAPSAEPTGFNPSTLALVHPPLSAEGDCEGDGDPCTDAIDCEVLDSVLLVGGLGSDHLVEIPIGDDGTWDPEVRQLELVGAAGIERIRATPTMTGPQDADFEGVHQFLYVIAGDGSTRVVRRELDPTRDEIGTECDTQVDPPFAQSNPVCYPVTQTPVGVRPPDRRAFANGPGLRAPGARVTDWTFKKVPEDTLGCLDLEPSLAPFGGPGRVVGIGTTSAGRIVYATMGQFDAVEGLDSAIDPVGLMDVGIRWHMLFPELSPVAGESIDPAALPTLVDERPLRRLPDEAGPTRYLAPGFRLIDWAYFFDEEIVGDDEERRTLGAAYGYIDDVDRMGGPEALEQPDSTGLYKESVVRAQARDYRAWGATLWEIIWEGDIPNTRSNTGQIECDEGDLGWEQATCRASFAGSSRLVDATADFCSAGVLAGDKLVIVGCSEDDDCGTGQRCLDRPGSLPGSGICVSEQAFLDDEQTLRQVCDEFISDPCGEPHREYLITRAYRDELWLQGMDVPPISYLAATGESECTEEDVACFPAIEEREARFVCTELQPDGGCTTDAECEELLADSDEADPDAEFLCIEERCRRACESPDECLLRRLPGPRCFRELMSYEVRVRNAFLVRGAQPATQFLPDQVFADPDSLSEYTGAPECKLGASGASSLLTSRIPLGADESDLELPLCESNDVTPSSASLNPCLVTVDRSAAPESLFHRFTYFGDQAGGEVTAVRYANPVVSLVIDLVDLRALGLPIPESDRGILNDADEGALWPPEFRHFRRSRIPRGYGMEFETASGYSPINAAVGIGQYGLTFPVRVLGAPDLGWTFVVDASGPGASTAIRGQVLRVDVSSNPPLADDSFDGVR